MDLKVCKTCKWWYEHGEIEYCDYFGEMSCYVQVCMEYQEK